MKMTVCSQILVVRFLSLLLVVCLAVVLTIGNSVQAAEMNTAKQMAHSMSVDEFGVLMNNNMNTLPDDCATLGPDVAFTVHAGTKYAAAYPGNIFGLSEHEYRVEPCSRVTVTFINDDDVRHQWMLHGLPKYLYPQGMFHLEAAGGQQRKGTFIVPSDDRTYLVHCDIAQHMEKGMKAQLIVGKGSGNLWSVPGISGDFERDLTLSKTSLLFIALASLASFTTAVFVLTRKINGSE